MSREELGKEREREGGKVVEVRGGKCKGSEKIEGK